MLSSCVLPLIKEGLIPFGETDLLGHTASRIKTKRGQYTFSGSELFNNQPQTLSDDDGFVVLGCYMDSTVS